MISLLLALAIASPSALPSPMPTPTRVDVVVQAGHEGRPASCARFPRHHCNLGAEGEVQWTPVVADEVTRVLRAHGVTVARLPADFDGRYVADAAVFIHFDGNDKPCSTGASIGYHRTTGKPAADAWRAYYGKYFPFRFMPDDFTNNLRDYYAFRQVKTTDGALVIELSEIDCPAQRAWTAPRLLWQGDLLAHFLSTLIGKGNVPDPGAFK